MIYLSAFAVSFLYVALKSFQQLNVMHHKILWVWPVSLGMGLCEVFLVGTIAVTAVSEGWLEMSFLGVSLGLGGAVGATLSMILHKKIREK